MYTIGVGDKGDKGDLGEKGDKGFDGPQGIVGEKGVQGPIGNQVKYQPNRDMSREQIIFPLLHDSWHVYHGFF